MRLLFALGASHFANAENAAAQVSSDGAISLGWTTEANLCGLPSSGRCAADWDTCFTFKSLYCPDWEGIALSGDCVIANANQICCDEIPAPCRDLWMSNYGDESPFCSKSKFCLRPHCKQKDAYLKAMYADRWTEDSHFGTCFFDSAEKPECTMDSVAMFGTPYVGLHAAVREANLLERAAAGSVASTAVDRALETKDSTLAEPTDTTADFDAMMTAFVQRNATTEMKQRLAALVQTETQDPFTPSARCQRIAQRRQICSLSSDWEFDDGELCPFCLEEGAQTPQCPGGTADAVDKDPTLNYFEKAYCKCCCLDETVDVCPSWVGNGPGYCSATAHVGACYDPHNDNKMVQCLPEDLFQGYRCPKHLPAKGRCSFR